MNRKTFSLSLLISILVTSAASANPSIECWGNNTEGQTKVPADLKFNTVPAKPVEVRTARGATCTLDSTGKVSCWGLPMLGLDKLQALTGVKTFSVSTGGSCALAGTTVQCFSAMGNSTFESVPSLKTPKNVSVGSTFACAQDSVGVKCWGGNTNATQVPKLKNPTKYIATDNTVCAMDSTGIKCWGDEFFSIESVPKLNKPTDFFLGRGFACAFDSKGLECWGTPQNNGLPAVPTVTNPLVTTHYVAGQAHICGLDTTGSVQCFGDNSVGQLNVPPLSHPTQIFADAPGNQTCALDDSGLVCWGEDQAGQSSLSAVSSVAAGLGTTCVTSQGKLECWGSGSKAIATPLQVTDAYQVTLGSNFACAVDVGGSSQTSCWGDNTALQALSTQLPTVDYTQGGQISASPTLTTSGYNHTCIYSNASGQFGSCVGNNDFGQSTLPTNFVATGNAGSMSAGGNHTCGIDVIAGLECWGENENGEATPPTTLKNPRMVTAGFYHTCALDDNGVSCWGRASEGQIAVPKLVNPRLVQAGGYHTCALDDNGVTCWGENSFGQSKVPSSLVLPNQGRKISNLATGQFHTCAVTQ